METRKDREIAAFYDVAVVGMGPVGATLSGLLARNGLRVLAVDTASDIYDMPRALGMDQEVMRVFQQLGLAEQLAPVISAYKPSEYRTAEGETIRRFVSQEPPYPLGWAPYMTFIQPELERILRNHAAGCETIDIHLETEVIGLTNAETQPELTLRRRTTGETVTTRARFVIGCDGGNSFVRRSLDIRFEDLVFDEPWIVIDMLLDEDVDLPDVNIQFCDPARPHTFVLGPRNLRRWEFMLLPGEEPGEMAQEQSVWNLLKPWLKPGQARLWRAATYRFHALVAEEWRKGQVFLAGDACHMTPPFLAQGMVQGIKDALNLAWKIAAVTKGAPASLLDTYETERRPLVREVISVTKALGQIICERDFEKAEQRNRRMREEIAAGRGTAVRQDLFPPIRDGLVFPGADPATDPAGRPAPQPLIRTTDGATRLLDDMTGCGFRLLALENFTIDEQSRTELARLGIGLHVIAAGDGASAQQGALIEEGRLFQDWMATRQCGAILVRPDHTVLAGLRNPSDLNDRLRALQPMLMAA